jgi:UDP-N-acetylglucosamine 1-carboxyvinyltransferase
MNKKESFIIEGLAGKKTLKGSVSVNGAKNAALKAIAATILFDGPTTLENIPDTDDIHTIVEVLIDLGATVKWGVGDNGKKTLMVDTGGVTKTDIDPDLARTMRASVVLTGPMLARFGKVSFPSPGGCVIGSRPIDLFIEGYKKMGATVTLKCEIYYIETSDGLGNADIFFNKVSVGGTETLMMSAVMSKGTTVLENCAMEPEIVNVAEWLNACGAKISGIGTTTLTIEGTGGQLLDAKKSHYVTIPDRIETGSFLILGALCAEELKIEDCRPDHLSIVINMLREAGVSIEILEGKSGNLNKTILVSNNASKSIGIVGENGAVKIAGSNSSQSNNFKSFSVRTHEYPGFPTDLQSPMVVFLTQALGESVVLETIFEGRFKYINDLTKMGADITAMNPFEIMIKGPKPLVELPDAEELCAYDIRAGFAIVVAALVGKGKFTVNNVHLIDRGYERLEERLRGIGAIISRL